LPGAPDPPRRPGHRGEVGAVGRRRQPGRRLRPADAGRGQAVPAEPWPWRRRHRRPAHRCRAGTGAALKEQPGASRDVPGTLPPALRGRRSNQTAASDREGPMAEFLKEEMGVAMSGVKWDLKDFKLWQSVNPNIVLFTPRQPKLAKSLDNGRYQAAFSAYRQQKEDGSYAITGGSAIFTLNSRKAQQ